MNKWLFVLIIIFTGLTSFGQKVRLRGELLNANSKVLKLTSFTGHFTDDIPINADGTFDYVTNQIEGPFEGTLTDYKDISFFIFVAPGYDMQINADVKDPKTRSKTTVYSGLGSKTNAYRKVYSDVMRSDTVQWNTKDADTYIKHLKDRSGILSGIIKKHFNSNTEPYSDYFKQSLLRDLKFSALDELYDSYAADNNLNWKQIKAMTAKLGIDSVEQELNKEVNLSGFSFSFFAISYPNYCQAYNAFPADEQFKKQVHYQMYLASRLYTGKVYDFFIYKNMPATLASTFKIEDLKKLQYYAGKVKDSKIKQSIQKEISARVAETLTLKAGAPAPLFDLPDTTGKMHHLAGFRGKVVYIDLWASWCGPCIEETPHLKKIAAHYKGNENLKIISIAAFDAKNREKRYEIIRKDQMDWLQLEDTEDSFSKACQVSFIPRFIIINKQGNIVDVNAARPSEPEKLIAILDSEMKK